MTTLRSPLLELPHQVRQLVGDFAWGPEVRLNAQLLGYNQQRFLPPLTPVIDVIANDFFDLWNYCEGEGLGFLNELQTYRHDPSRRLDIQDIETDFVCELLSDNDNELLYGGSVTILAYDVFMNENEPKDWWENRSPWGTRYYEPLHPVRHSTLDGCWVCPADLQYLFEPQEGPADGPDAVIAEAIQSDSEPDSLFDSSDD